MPVEIWLAQVVLSALIACLLLAVNLYGVEGIHSARDNMGKYLAWLPPVVLHLSLFVVVGELFLIAGTPSGIAVLVMSVFCVLSAVWPRKFSPQFLLNWSTQGAGIARAKTLVSESFEKSLLKIEECRTSSTQAKREPLRNRFLKALEILLDEDPKNSEGLTRVSSRAVR